MEECCELAHVASKMKRFTPDSDYDGITNREKLQKEYNDVLAIVKMLYTEGIDAHDDLELIEAKKQKVEKFLEDSKRLGTLTDD